MIWRRRLDIPLQRDGSVRFLPWLIALMVYLASLALAGTLALDAVLRHWDLSLSSVMTVEIPAPAAAPPPGGQVTSGPAISGQPTSGRPGTGQPSSDASLAAALAVLKAAPGVIAAEALDRGATAKLVEPWLGTALSPDELALPRLIDVRTRPGDLDLGALRASLAAAAPGAILDDHRSWLDRLAALGLTIEGTAIGILALVAGAAVLTVIFTTRAGLAVHDDVIDLLHLMGARDGYIARQFQREALRLGVKGGIIGLALAALTLAALAHAAARADALFGDQVSLLPSLRLTPWQWASLLLLPLLAGIIAMVTARITVMRALARLP
jgi:cell division transport system permease protein